MNYILLVLLLISIVLLILKTHYIPRKSVIFMLDRDIKSIDFNTTVIKLWIIKTHIFENITRFCGDKYSHWGILIKTLDDKYYILSSSRHRNIYVYSINKDQIHDKYIKKNKNKNPKYVRDTNIDGFDCDCALGTMLDYMFNLVKSVSYSSFGTNCHFIVKNILHMFCGMDFPNLDIVESFVEIMQDRLLGKNIFQK